MPDGETACRILYILEDILRANAVQDAAPFEHRLHLGVQLGDSQCHSVRYEIASDFIEHGKGGAVDLGNCTGVKYEPAGAGG